MIIWRNQTCDYFSLAIKVPERYTSPSLINIACGSCTLLNLALHLSKFARAHSHCHMRRITVTGPCALQGMSGSPACKRWASQDGFMAWTLVLSSPNHNGPMNNSSAEGFPFNLPHEVTCVVNGLQVPLSPLLCHLASDKGQKGFKRSHLNHLFPNADPNCLPLIHSESELKKKKNFLSAIPSVSDLGCKKVIINK